MPIYIWGKQMDFKKISIEDKSVFDCKLSKEIFNSEYQFSTLFIWQESFDFCYTIYKEFILVFGKQHNGNLQCYYPIGSGDLFDCVKYIKEYFKNIGMPFNMRPMSKDMLDNISPFLSDNISIGFKDSYSDYIYDYERIKTYSGKEYKRKRKQVNYFRNNYNYIYETIKYSDKDLVLNRLHEIMKMDKHYDEDEWIAYQRMFNNFNELNLRGGLIKVDGIIEAISVGELHGDSIIMHLRRCNKIYKGIYPTILQLLLQNEFNEEWLHFINCQDDVGILNLRKSKLSYHPKFILKKYYAIEEF